MPDASRNQSEPKKFTAFSETAGFSSSVADLVWADYGQAHLIIGMTSLSQERDPVAASGRIEARALEAA